MEVAHEGLNRPYEPCPFRCLSCGARAKIVTDLPEGCVLSPIAAKPLKSTPLEKESAPLGTWHTPSF